MAKKKVSDRHKNHSEAPVPKGRLLAIGGHEDKGRKALKKEQARNVNFEKEEILKFFISELRGDNPMVAIVPTASTIPEEVAKDYKQFFNKQNIKNIEVIDVRQRPDTNNKDFFDIVERASGIMFPGGDQLRLTSILGGTALLELMKERYTYDEDIIIAGTSAGATAMSTPMIYEVETQGGFIKGDVRITTGLEFMKNVAIDTHFIERGRIVRMAQCISTNPGCIGVGLEEDTAIYITEGSHFKVLGSGLVSVIDGMGITHTNIYEIDTGEAFSIRDMRVHLLCEGETYTIPTFDQLHI